jgi:hypothetical protein
LTKSVSGLTQVALQNLFATLKTYATGRAVGARVGQFLDEEGRNQGQHGIYGMGSWIALADDDSSSIRNEPAVRRITDECQEELRRLVRQAKAGEKEAAPLRSVIPKMCYAHMGLEKFPDCQPEANFLSEWISQAQKPDGSWGYIVASSSGFPEITALVVRCFAREQTLSQEIHRAVEYLQKSYSSSNNPFLRLYALNTLLLHDPQNARAYKSAVKKGVAKLLNQAFFNPTQFPNPINLDFNDAARTRYIRISADVILLESLELISGSRRLYVRGHPGRRIFNHLMKTLASPPTRDTTGHRLSPPSALYLHECLRRLTGTRQLSGVVGLIETGLAYLMCSWAFGVNIGWNLISVGVTVTGVIVALLIRSKFALGNVLVGAFLGALLKSALDLGKSVYNTFTRFGGE